MPFFTALTNARQLPELNSEIECAVVDWKAPGAISATPFHKAKDVAAFANHLGGVLLIGACEGRGGLLAKYEGMTMADAKRIEGAFSQAVVQKCQPQPTIDSVPLELPGHPNTFVLAVNVSPSLNLVGVRLKADPAEKYEGNDSFVFPVRTGTHTKFLEPVELAMYMTPQVRRVAVLLSRIPPGTPVKIDHVNVVAHAPVLKFVEVLEEMNTVRFKSPQSESEAIFPLDRILSVYEGIDPQTKRREWRVHYAP